MDRGAFGRANGLGGNPDDAAGFECTLAGPRLEILAPGALAATGAEMPLSVTDRQAPRWRTVAVRAGDIVSLGLARRGIRGYLAFAGGLDLPLVLGSRATYLRGRLGGYNGRRPRRGDAVRLRARRPGPAPLLHPR